MEVWWTALTDQFEREVTSESRNALVFAVASASYMFLQRQVCRYSLEMVYHISYTDIFLKDKTTAGTMENSAMPGC